MSDNPMMEAAASAACLITAAEGQRMARAFAVAAQLLPWHLALYCDKVRIGTSTWLDTRPLLDMREHTAESIDMSLLMITHALTEGLAKRHHDMPHLIRLVYGGWRP